MANIFNNRAYRDYDREILSDEDYGRLQGYQQQWQQATDDAGRQQANQQAQQLREQYGYSMGGDGRTFTINNPQTGVSQDTGAQLLHYQSQQNNPTGRSDLYQQYQDLLNQYTNRKPFTYDVTEDGLYQQYANQYQRLGNQAMQDTLGQAAGLTGGYNSSYAQSAGQQAYQGYLDQLNDIVPELYGQAYSRYAAEGDRIANAAQLAAQGYGQEQTDYWNNLNYWQNQAQNEQNQYWNQQQYDQTARQQAYSNLVTAISNTGYRPTSGELQAAGMTQSEADQWAAYFSFNRQQALATKSGGGRSSGGRRSGGSPVRRSSESSSESSGTDAVAEAAASYAAAHSGGHLDDRSLDTYLSSQGYTTAQRSAFKQYLESIGWTYGRRQ